MRKTEVDKAILQSIAMRRFQCSYGATKMTISEPELIDNDEKYWSVGVQGTNIGDRYIISLQEYIQYVREKKLAELGI